jgi:hypothetical protein
VPPKAHLGVTHLGVFRESPLCRKVCCLAVAPLELGRSVYPLLFIPESFHN